MFGKLIILELKVIFLGDFSFWENILKLACYHDNYFKYFMVRKYNGFVSKARGFRMHVFSSV
jgi:homogentisate 1,2-dioxygenase